MTENKRQTIVRQVPLCWSSIQLIWRRVGPQFASFATRRGVEARASMTYHLNAAVLLSSSALIHGKMAFAFHRLPTAVSDHMQRPSDESDLNSPPGRQCLDPKSNRGDAIAEVYTSITTLNTTTYELFNSELATLL
ncbi:hypothetical protein NPIL_351841 [Nephila pilipes]|uniref:Uncharacterized protein n=1 Tax=Nephila pilipes TaxID=299642 RepID=A0A8X6UTN3_NEPPI|nr:hypothetical protein NPIL_351841 [Nephila pilipes]